MSKGGIWLLIVLAAIALLVATPFEFIGIGVGVWLGMKLFRRPQSHAAGQSGDALDILKRRYASGEITREQYEQMRHDLER